MRASLRGYFKETRRPIYSAALVLPFFIIYHVGTIFLHTTYINGADALIIRLLSNLSVHSVFASALVLLACFVIWQMRTRASWKIDSAKLTALYIESLFFGLVLFFAFGWVSVNFSRASPGAARAGSIEKIVLYCGAGIYEELVFRAFLLLLLMFLFARVFRSRNVAGAIAAVCAALLFALFHYVGRSGDSFTVGSFLQRTLGGLYFSILFVTRGFGVTAASHALYDVIVGLTGP